MMFGRGQPGGWLLSFVRPKESNQRKCRPDSSPLRFSPVQAAATQGDFLRGAQLPRWLDDCCGCGRELFAKELPALLAQCSRQPPDWLRYSATHRGVSVLRRDRSKW